MEFTPDNDEEIEADIQREVLRNRSTTQQSDSRDLVLCLLSWLKWSKMMAGWLLNVYWDWSCTISGTLLLMRTMCIQQTQQYHHWPK